MTAPKKPYESGLAAGTPPGPCPIVAVLRSRLSPMFAGLCVGVLPEDVAEVRSRGEATRDGDIFELTARGAEQLGSGFDAATLQPIVGAHPLFLNSCPHGRLYLRYNDQLAGLV